MINQWKINQYLLAQIEKTLLSFFRCEGLARLLINYSITSVSMNNECRMPPCTQFSARCGGLRKLKECHPEQNLIENLAWKWTKLHSIFCQVLWKTRGGTDRPYLLPPWVSLIFKYLVKYITNWTRVCEQRRKRVTWLKLSSLFFLSRRWQMDACLTVDAFILKGPTNNEINSSISFFRRSWA